MIPTRRTLTLSLAALLAACGKSEPETIDGVLDPAASPDVATPAETAKDAASLKSLLDLKLAAHGVPALAAALVQADGLAFSAASGVRRIGDPARVTASDPWHIGSDTKAMTAALYARLVDAGRAKWGAALPDLFPSLDIDPAWRAVSIEHLMSHRSGAADIGLPWLIAARTDSRALPDQRLATARDWLSKPPANPVGAFAYANVNYILAGAAIEQITKTSWEEAIAADVFGPLNMSGAGFGAPAGDAPQGHKTVLGRLQQAGVGPGADNPPALGPAGTVHLPLEAWANFVRIFIDPGQTFLSADSLHRLITPAPGADYALGWGVDADPKARLILTHAGSNTMWLAQAVLAPDKRFAILAAANCAGDAADTAIRETTAALMQGQLGAG